MEKKDENNGTGENLNDCLAQEKDLLLMEHDQDCGAYQKLQRDYQSLKGRAEEFQRNLAVYIQDQSRSVNNFSSSCGAFIKHEIGPLTSENLNVQENYDKVTEEYQELKEHCKILAKRLRDAGIPDPVEPTVNQTLPALQSTNETIMPAIPEKARDYKGMIEFQKNDITMIICHLVIKLEPKVAVTMLPSLPAYIIFMCIRHAIYINEDDKVSTLLIAYLDTVNLVIYKRVDFDFRVLWLSNTLRLLHNMKQYSCGKQSHIEKTSWSNAVCFQDVYFIVFKSALYNRAISIFHKIMTMSKNRIEAHIVPALLEHQVIIGLSSNKLASSQLSLISTELNMLLDELRSMHKTFQIHSLDPDVIIEIFKQLFYFMCAIALNRLLQRYRMCNETNGRQIRHKLDYLERWARNEKLFSAAEALQPLIQATQLLQTRKTVADVTSICEMCNKLTANQIIIILYNFYVPVDGIETGVPESFMETVHAELKQRQEDNDEVLMNSKFSYPIKFSFNPSNIQLEDIEIPPVLNLPMLKKV